MLDTHLSSSSISGRLYTIILWTVNLAKYAGPAACYPPSRKVCNQLFDAADVDQSGGIEKDEFVKIIGITCAQILSRILVYYLVLILLVPVLATRLVDWLQIPNGSYQEMAAEQTIGLGLFFVVIPFVWNFIDDYSEHKLEQGGNHTDNSDSNNNKKQSKTTSKKENWSLKNRPKMNRIILEQELTISTGKIEIVLDDDYKIIRGDSMIA